MLELLVSATILNVIYVFLVLSDNIRCEGERLMDAAEQCHYSKEFRDDCAAPVFDNETVVPINNKSRILCTCKIRNGQSVCADC